MTTTGTGQQQAQSRYGYTETECQSMTNENKGWLVQRVVEKLFATTDEPLDLSTLRITVEPSRPPFPEGWHSISATISTYPEGTP